MHIAEIKAVKGVLKSQGLEPSFVERCPSTSSGVSVALGTPPQASHNEAKILGKAYFSGAMLDSALRNAPSDRSHREISVKTYGTGMIGRGPGSASERACQGEAREPSFAAAGMAQTLRDEAPRHCTALIASVVTKVASALASNT